LRTEETAELWSDWATAQYGLSQFAEAERGFRRALELDPGMSDAAVNFGMLLSSQGRYGEALAFFEKALPKLGAEGRTAVQNFIQQCRVQLGPPAPEPRRPRSGRKGRRVKARR
jgi:Tfp pilus assembly protein PilF